MSSILRHGKWIYHYCFEEDGMRWTKVAVQRTQRRKSLVRWAENIKIDHNEVGHEKGGLNFCDPG